MSNYGVLVVECEGSYQIVAEVSSRSEALEMAANYLSNAGPDQDCLAPESFVINRRGPRGWFTVREVLADQDVCEAQDLLAEIKRVERALRVANPRRPSSESMRMDLENLNNRLTCIGGAR